MSLHDPQNMLPYLCSLPIISGCHHVIAARKKLEKTLEFNPVVCLYKISHKSVEFFQISLKEWLFYKHTTWAKK